MMRKFEHEKRNMETRLTGAGASFWISLSFNERTA